MGTTVIGTHRVGAILDLENLLHTARRSSGLIVRAQFAAIVEQVRGLGEVRSAVGCCDWWLAKLLVPAAVTSGVRVFAGGLGRDRADHELLRRAGDVPASVDTFVVGSGDRAFAPLVADQALRGRRTVVIGRAGSISRALRAAADTVIELQPRVIDLGQQMSDVAA